VVDKMTLKRLQDEIHKKLGELGLSMTDLAERSGVSRSELYKLMEGRVQEPSPNTLRRIAGVLHESDTWIFRLTYDYLKPLKREGRPKKYRVGYSTGWVGATEPDDIQVAVNQRFEETWEIQNDGDQTWHHFSLVNIDDPNNRNYIRPDRSVIPLPEEVKPGETVCLTACFTAPAFGGPCRSNWKLEDESGEFVFPELTGVWIEIIVHEW
jgi:transcriptional regulator with XRE-family HTH domain